MMLVLVGALSLGAGLIFGSWNAARIEVEREQFRRLMRQRYGGEGSFPHRRVS
jgi:hypothetical protein